MAYFPMFVDITGQKCLIVGGGRVAKRKVQVLLDFGARVVLVAKEISDDIKEIASEKSEDGNISLHEKEFEDTDIEGAMIVVVATGDKKLNDHIYALCREKRIPINVVDVKEMCSFIFPSYVREGNLVGAFSSSGNSPVLAKYLKDKTSAFLTKDLGELNEYLGQLRPQVFESIKDEPGRKACYEKILEEYLSGRYQFRS